MHWNKLTEANTVKLKEILPGSSVKFIIGGSGVCVCVCVFVSLCNTFILFPLICLIIN